MVRFNLCTPSDTSAQLHPPQPPGNNVTMNRKTNFRRHTLTWHDYAPPPPESHHGRHECENQFDVILIRRFSSSKPPPRTRWTWNFWKAKGIWMAEQKDNERGKERNQNLLNSNKYPHRKKKCNWKKPVNRENCVPHAQWLPMHQRSLFIGEAHTKKMVVWFSAAWWLRAGEEMNGKKSVHSLTGTLLKCTITN